MAEKTTYKLNPVKVDVPGGHKYTLTASMVLNRRPNEPQWVRWGLIAYLGGALMRTGEIKVKAGSEPPFAKASAWTKQTTTRHLDTGKPAVIHGSLTWR